MNEIIFLFPIVPNLPTGGLKVVYDYSNRLVNDGFKVTIVYAAYFNSTDKSLRRKIKALAKYIYAKIVFDRKGYSWYHKGNEIKEKFVWNLNYNRIPKADVYIATAVNTAPYVAEFPVERSKKLYFIQDYEAFIVNDDTFIRETYRLPLRKIVISKWLSKMVNEEGQDCFIVPNGFDSKRFRLTTPIEQKDKYLISMLYHVNERKDIPVGMRAIELAQEKIPQLRVLMFGAYPEPQGLPNWVTYYQKPSDEKHLEINNKAAIYVGCSKIEGWGLTVGEAMMCGQAVACTDNDGYKEMATDGVNALITPVGDADALATSIVRLVEDDSLRQRLANRGIETIKAFDFEKSYAMFKDFVITEG